MSRSPRLFLFALLALAGCNQAPSSPTTPTAAAPPLAASTGVATIDVDGISAQLGLTKELEVRLQQLQQNFEAFRRAKQSQIAELQKKLPEKPTDEQIREFRKADREAAGEIQRAQANANQQFQEFGAYVRNVLELTMKDPVDQVMKKRNLAIVLNVHSGVIRRLDSADITKDVLEIIDKSEPRIKLPTMPTTQPTSEAPAKTSGSLPELQGKDNAPTKPAIGPKP